MLNDFSNVLYKKIINIIDERIINTKNSNISSEEYSSLTSEINALINEIDNFLPNDKKHLIYQLEELFSNQEQLAEKFMYMQGFKDGIDLKDK